MSANPRKAATVVLAAGSASRYGSPKQLAIVDGRPILQRVLDALAGFGEPQVLVLGAEAQRVRSVVATRGWRVVVADDWAAGLGASLRAGLASAPLATSVLIALGDLPWLSREAVQRVLQASADNQAFEAVRAFEDKAPGHPLLLRGQLLERARVAPDEGMRDALTPASILRVRCEGLGVALDVDEPGDAVVRPSIPT